MADHDHLFQRLCHEAVVACGSDREAIERYVRGRIATMDGVDRQMITRDVDLVLGFRAPESSTTSH